MSNDQQNPIEEEVLQRKDAPGDTDMFIIGDTTRDNPDYAVTFKNLKHAINSIVDAKSARQSEAATTTFVADDFDKNIDNVGASGAVVYTLPAAADVKGRAMTVYVGAAQQVSLDPASGEKIYLLGDGVVDKDLVIAGTIGNFVTIYSDGTDYIVLEANGVVTKEA